MIDLQTGKYAFYIWTAYGLTALVFGVLIVASLNHARHWRARFEELSRNDPRS